MHHRHLLRQLAKLGLDPDHPPKPDQWRQLLDRMSRSFDDADRERYLLERSIQLSSREMQELNARLAAERDQFAQIFRNAPVGMARVELDGKFSAANPAFADILGCTADELVGRLVVDLVDPACRAEADFLDSVLQGSKPSATGQTRFQHSSGAPVLGTLSATAVLDENRLPQHVILVLEDISERSRLEIELRHSQKLESVGRLAAGVAHEINTPIQFVGNNITFLGSAFADLLELVRAYRGMCDKAQAGPLGPEDAAALRDAEESADLEYAQENVPRSLASTQEGIGRVAKIVQSMKTFAYPDMGARTTADINAALLSTLTVASSELKYVAEVETDLQDLPPIPCYLSDINQVFLNLLVNAAHAIGDVVVARGERGRIRVSTRREERHVVIAISDTGTGIPEEIQGRIFDPFFTTKEVGKGTGQGLALARNVVVEKHGGSLTFETAPGQGTTFYIRLPLLAELLASASDSASTEAA